MIGDTVMFHPDMNLPNLKTPLDMALRKIMATYFPKFTVPDRLSHLLSSLLTLHGTTGRAMHLTFTKLSNVVQISFHTYLRQGKYNIPLEFNR
jgi:hypothetical protein